MLNEAELKVVSLFSRLPRFFLPRLFSLALTKPQATQPNYDITTKAEFFLFLFYYFFICGIAVFRNTECPPPAREILPTYQES